MSGCAQGGDGQEERSEFLSQANLHFHFCTMFAQNAGNSKHTVHFSSFLLKRSGKNSPFGFNIGFFSMESGLGPGTITTGIGWIH